MSTTILYHAIACKKDIPKMDEIELNVHLSLCENKCSKYYQCDKVAEMNDKLKKIEEE